MAKAIRDVYGETLKKYGAMNENIVVLDADVSGSTKIGHVRKGVSGPFL